MDTTHAYVEGDLSDLNMVFYQENGYLIVPKVFSNDFTQELKQETTAIFSGKRGEVEGAIALESNLSENEILSKYAAIHFPHKISLVMKKAASDIKIAKLLSKLVSPNVKCLQTMLFVKAPGKKGQSWHQDEFFIPTRDRSLTGVWIGLEDADVENGCLWVIPGSHKDGIIKKRVVNTNNQYADLETLDTEPYTEKDFQAVAVKSGDVIIFDGYLMHMSLANKSKKRFRRALVGHYCSAESMLPWDQDGRQAPTQDFRDIFMVSGVDPYAYKGIEDLSKPFVRPDVLDFNTEQSRNSLKK